MLKERAFPEQVQMGLASLKQMLMQHPRPDKQKLVRYQIGEHMHID